MEPLADAAVPPGPGLSWTTRTLRGRAYRSLACEASDLGALADRLERFGTSALAALGDEPLLDAWRRTLARFADPDSRERHALEPWLVAGTGLSPQGLAAALEVVLSGVAGAAAEALFARAERAADRRPALAILAENIPALGLQVLLPALALRRPILLKSPSREPFLLAAFVAALVGELPALAPSIAALTWKGGQRDLEAPLLARVGKVIAYGEEATLTDLAPRLAAPLVERGPRFSLACVGRDADLEAAARGLARDIALFDQRGCLSPQAIYTTAPAEPLARALATALAALSLRWPMGEMPLPALASVRLWREEAALGGLLAGPPDLRQGTVVLAESAGFVASPGLRTVRVHAVAGFAEVIAALSAERGRIQGVALAGAEAWAQLPALRELRATRLAEAGDLQAADAAWQNGGLDPLAALR